MMKRPVLCLAGMLLPLLAVSCAGPRTAYRAGEPEIIEDMVVVRQGWFTMGDDDGEVNERPEHKVFNSIFMIDRYEVSAARFAEFLNDAGNEDGRFFTGGRFATVVRASDGTYEPRKGYESYPANNVSWEGASAFCRWVEKRLPTEAEWEKAARGGDGRLYPWGDELPSTEKARYNMEIKPDGLDMLVPVDALEAGSSVFGALNMSGNVWEWTSDWYRQNYCQFCDDLEGTGVIAAQLLGYDEEVIRSEWSRSQETPERVDPRGPAIGSFKVLRGGSWSDDETMIETSVRYWRLPTDREPNIGFRCARGGIK